MKSGATSTDLNSPEKLEFEVARILAKRKKRLGSAHSLSPAELRKSTIGQNARPIENSKKIFLVTEATQTEPSKDVESRTTNGRVFGDYKSYSDDLRDRLLFGPNSSAHGPSPSSSYKGESYNRASFEDPRDFANSSGYRKSYEEKSVDHSPPVMRRAASAHTSPWALKRDMFLDDDVPDFTTSSAQHRPKPTPYQSTNFTTAISGYDRYAPNIPTPVTNSASPNKPLSDQIADQITKNVYYSDHRVPTHPTTAPSSPFFPHFATPPKPPQHTAARPRTPPPPTQNPQWQPEQLQQQLLQHQQQQQPKTQTQNPQPPQDLHPPQTHSLQQPPTQNLQPQTTQGLQQTPSQKSRYQLSPENSEIFDVPSKQPTIPTTPPVHQPINHSPQSRPLSPLTSSYAVGDTDSVYSESDIEQDDQDYQEEEEFYEPTVEDHVNVVLTGTELLMVMEKGMQRYHVAVNMPSMTKLVWSERGKVVGSQELKDVTDVSNLPHAVHPQLDNLQWHTAVSGGPLAKWGDSAWGTLGVSLTVKKSIKGASRRKKIDFVCGSHDIQQSWVIGLNALMHSKSQFQNGRKSAALPFAITNGSGSNEVEKVVAYLDKVMGMDETVVDKVAQLVEQKRRVIHSTSPPRASKRNSLTITPVVPSFLSSPAPSLPSSSPAPSFPLPPTPTHATPAPAPLSSASAPAYDPAHAPPSAPASAPAQSEPRAPPTFTRSNTPTLPLVARPPITRSNTSTGVLRVSPPGVKPRAPVARASSPLRRSLHL